LSEKHSENNNKLYPSVQWSDWLGNATPE